MKTYQTKFSLIFMVILLWALPASAQWSPDSTINLPITNLSSNPYNPMITADGAGGAILTWYDYRGTDADIYAQRVNAAGVPQWTTNGVLICGATNTQSAPMIISDGAGGAIIAWQDYRTGTNYDVYAQKVNASGLVQWTSNGVPICTNTANQYAPQIVTDGSGGAIIGWFDFRNGADYDIYAQRVNASGSVQWTTDGVVVCNAGQSQYLSDIEPDGAGGAIFAWYDYRNGTDYDIYAQRLNGSGAIQWAANGVLVCGGPPYGKSQYSPLIAADGSGGGIISWYDYRNDTGKVYAQRINATGAVQWTTNGIAICPTPNYQAVQDIVSDGAGGAVIAWYDYRNGVDGDIYAQRVSSTGTIMWAATGVGLCTAANYQYPAYKSMVGDGTGGAVLAWYDLRNGADYNIYAQRVNGNGVVQWTANGVNLCSAPSSQYSPVMAASGSGNAIVAWTDYRSSSYANVYAQFLSSSGKRLPPPVVSTTPPSVAPVGQTLIVSATITVTSPFNSAAMYYRKGGDPSFFSTLMYGSGPSYQDSIPANSVTARGLEYYIVATDSIGNVTRVPSSGVLAISTTVGSAGLAADNPQPGGSDQTAYRLVSIPLNATNKSAQTILPAVLGGYDNTKWRFFELKIDQTYGEFPGTITMDPGKAFWLIVKDGGKTLNTGAGKSIPTNVSYAVGLNPGWTFVGDPFDFAIPLTQLSLKSGSALDARAYGGSWASASGSIQPFLGYAVANGHPTADTLYINPVLTPAPTPAPGTSPSREDQQLNWSIGVAAQCEAAREDDILLGVSPAASNGLDAFDRPQAPLIGDYVAMYFPHPEWGSVFRNYTTDIHGEVKEGTVWAVEVRSNIHDRVTLTFNGINSVPSQLQVWLIDDLLKPATNLRLSNTASFMNGDASDAHPMSVVVGTESYVREKLAANGAIPMTYGLDQNFPNPFNPVTTIRYALPEASHVLLKVFDVLGREVRTLVDGDQAQGYQAVQFDAGNLASGIYYYRLTVDDPSANGSSGAPRFSETKKLLLMK